MRAWKERQEIEEAFREPEERKCPVDFHSWVTITCRNGRQLTGLAGSFDWNIEHSFDDIVSWEVWK